MRRTITAGILGAAIATLVVLAATGQFASSLPLPDPHGFPVECVLMRGANGTVGIDPGRCYQLGRHVRSPLDDPSTSSCASAGAAQAFSWQGLLGPGNDSPLAATYTCRAFSTN